jgi:tyrosyl-tRNA synthetase
MASKIEEVLSRGVAQVLPSRKGLANLMKRKKIRLYFGVDPTSPNLHLGHSIPLRKLREFQELGHEVIFLVGDFTAQIGDPSERDKKRKPLSPEQIRENMATYKKQASKILDLSQAKIAYNSKWLSKMDLKQFLGLASHFTISRLLERDMFERRLKKGGEVWLNEIFYPLMQGYDSVALNVDLEIGSTDQTFNMLVGRKLQRIYNQKEKFVLTTPMLLGADGRKMSKSYHNTINLEDLPNDMFGKIMSLKDDLIGEYFELCTNLPLSEIQEMRKKLKSKKVNPRDLKERLAFEIVSLYYNRTKAERAKREFERVFKEKKLPSDIPLYFSPKKRYPVLELLVYLNLASSKSEAKRLILQKGVRVKVKDKIFKIENPREEVEIKEGMIVQVGKRKFAQLTYVKQK